MQPGQLVIVNGYVEHAPLMRAVARAAYKAGAGRVEPRYTDRHATSHIAYGSGFDYVVEDEKDRAAGLNQSAAHTDFMVGGPEVDVDGQEQGGAWIPILRHDEFQI